MKLQHVCSLRAWMDKCKWIMILKKLNRGVRRGFNTTYQGFGAIIHLHLQNYPCTEHTRCIFMWFTLQFGHFLQRWRVRFIGV